MLTNKPSLAEVNRLIRERKKVFTDAEKADREGRNAEAKRLLDKAEELTADIVNEKRALEAADSAETFAEPTQRGEAEYRDVDTGEALRVFRAGEARRNYHGPTIGQIAHAQLTGRGLEELRAQGIGSGAAGGFAIPEDVYNRIIEVVANRSTVMQSGAPIVSMPRGQMRVAKIDSVTAGSWTEENAEIDSATVEFGAVEMTAKKNALLLKVSNELMNDSPNAVQALDRAITDAVALAVDQGTLTGTGAGSQPLGLLNWEDSDTNPLPTTDLSDTVAEWSDIIGAYYGLLAENAGPQIALFMNPLNLGLLDTEVATESGHYLMGRPAARDQIRLVASNQLEAESDKSTIVMGDFAGGLVIGMTGQMEAEWSKAPGFDRDQVWLRVKMRMDLGVVRSSFFRLLTNAKTTA